MKIAISFITTKFSALKSFWRKSKNVSKKSKFFGTDTFEEINLGGLFLILNWSKKEIIKKINLKTPAGFDYDRRNFYITTAGNSINIYSKDLIFKRKIINPFLNDIHSLNLTSKNSLLIASTGLDLILNLDKNGKKLYWWSARDKGYKYDPLSRLQVFSFKDNHRYKKYPTLKQTTHLNSAIFVENRGYYPETIYCSLFHQGEILAINAKNDESKILLKNLHHPHSLYRLGDKIIISDTENAQIIITNLNFGKIHKIKLKGFNWIQDTSLLSNGNLLICDSNNNRIVEMNPFNKTILSEFKYNPEWRIYQAKQIK
jgi:hypothetical protein